MSVSFIFVGHPGKIAMMAYIPLVYYFLLNYFSSYKFSQLFFAGIFLGIAYTESAIQSLLYHSIVVAAYFVFKTFRRSFRSANAIDKKGFLGELLKFGIVPVSAFIIALPVLSGFFNIAFDTSKVEDAQIERENEELTNYSWATTWSFPPEEVIDLVVPGMFGLKTGSREYPYWGRTGKTPEWTLQNPVGFQNFNFAGNYLGLLTFFLMLIAWLRKRNDETWFWTSVFVLSLLLAFGRFFPLYRLFYEIPFMDKFRNPNKFLHLVHLSSVMIALQGLVYFENRFLWSTEDRTTKPDERSLFKILAYVTIGLLLILFAVVNLYQNDLLKHLSKFYNLKIAAQMTSNMYSFLGRYFFVSTLMLIALYFIVFRKATSLKSHRALIYLFICIGIADLIHYNHLYLEFSKYPVPKREGKDPLVQFLSDEVKASPFRVKILNRGAYLGHFMTLLVPKHKFQSLDPPAESRPPADFYQGYYKYMDMYKLKSYGILNVKYFLTTSMLPGGMLKLVHQFYHPGTRETIYTYENPFWVPKIYAVPGKIVETNKIQSLEYMNSSLFNPLEQVVFHEEIEEAPGEKNPWVGYQITNLKYEHASISFDIALPQKAYVVVADQYHEGWRAKANGKEIKHHRVNYFQRAVILDKGNHRIEMKFSPSKLFFHISWLSWLTVIVLLGSYGCKEFLPRKQEGLAQSK